MKTTSSSSASARFLVQTLLPSFKPARASKFITLPGSLGAFVRLYYADLQSRTSSSCMARSSTTRLISRQLLTALSPSGSQCRNSASTFRSTSTVSPSRSTTPSASKTPSSASYHLANGGARDRRRIRNVYSSSVVSRAYAQFIALAERV